MGAKCNCDYVLPNQHGLEPHYDNCQTLWDRQRVYSRNEDGTLRLLNENLSSLDNDVLYHLGLDKKNYDLTKLFGDIKFICTGGTKERMRDFAKYIGQLLGFADEEKLVNLTKHSHRYAMYKVGPVLSISHGIGIPSMTILLQELIKLISYAKMKDPIIFRIGTSGGLNVPPGSVVISSFGLNGTLQKTYDVPVLGKIRHFPAVFDRRLSQELFTLGSAKDGYVTCVGGTMAADDFYRGQARLDGPFCDHTEADKMSFLSTLVSLGVKNIEMEATAFSALMREAGLRAADVCVTLLNRMEGDQVTSTTSILQQYQQRPMILVGRLIQKYYENKV